MKSKVRFICLIVISLFFIIIICANLPGHKGNDNVSDDFVQFIDEMFLDQSRVEVWNQEGEDITIDFFANNKDYYIDKNYQNIRDYVHDKVDKMSIENNKISIIDDKSQFVTQTVTRSYCKPIKLEESDGEVRYSISGSYVWDNSTHEITSVQDSVIGYISHNFGEEWRMETYSGSTAKKLASDKTSVTFTGWFRMKAECYQEDKLIDTVDLGNFTGEVIGYPTDKGV